MPVAQGTLKDLQLSSTAGSNFRGLTIAAISLALIPIAALVGISGALHSGSPAGDAY